MAFLWTGAQELLFYQVELIRNNYVQAILATLLSTFIFWLCRRSRVKVPSSEPCATKTLSSDSTPQTLRKRDIVRRVGKQFVEKFGQFGPLGRPRRAGSHRRRQSKQLPRLFWNKEDDSLKQLLNLEPPEELLEADNLEDGNQLPSEVLYLLKSVRVFGHFEKPLFIELCKNVETKFLPAGAILFRPGEPDDSVYVVKSGKLKVFLIDRDGNELPLKEVGTGESVHSLLCILDTLIDRPKNYSYVVAKALRDSYVLQVKASTYKNFLLENPDSLLRMIQIIMVRLQRVTFFAVSKVLGLSSELFIQRMKISGLEILKLKCNQQPVEQAPQQKVMHSPQIDSDDDYLEAEDQPFSIPSRSSSRPKGTKRRVRWLGSEDDSSDTDGDPVTQIFVPNTQPDFDVVIDQARVDRDRFMIGEGGAVSSVPVRKGVRGRFSHFTSSVTNEVLKAVTVDLVRMFRLENDSLLKGRLQIIEAPVNSVIINEGTQDHSIFFLASGGLTIYRESGDGEEVILYNPVPGEFVGILSALTGEPSFISCKATKDSHLILITKTHLYQILSASPKAVRGLAYDLTQRLSPFLRHIDFALDWMVLDAGKALYKQGVPSDCAYIVLNGRLRSVLKKSDGKREMVEEMGRGETVGLIEVITKAQRATTVHAIRDTELAQLPVGLIETTKVKQPKVVARLITLLGKKILGNYTKLSAAPVTAPDPVLGGIKSTTSNLSTIAVVAMTPEVPLIQFTKTLCRTINCISSCLRLTSSLVQEKLGSKILDGLSEYRLRNWLGHQEDNHRIVLYEADPLVTSWTMRCIRQADHILLLGLAEDGPKTGKILESVKTLALRVQKELVLLHREDVQNPSKTRVWLNTFGWVSSYFHVRCPDYIFTKHLSQEDGKFLPPCPDKHSDFSRLARKLTGTSIGLVLGGGGARGLSHAGVLKAMEEAGIPIDMIGGTSIGAFIGAIYCEEVNADKTIHRTREWAKRMGSLKEKIFDLTYPITSMFTGCAFNNLIHQTFKEKQIEDLWIPYFCITTDITQSQMKVHQNGNLWRYVRASMSLSGYLPPLCDPTDGHLLLDGGYINNLPADVMLNQGAKTIISVDVGAEDNNDLTNYGDSVSGWSLLLNRWNPFAKKMRVPNLTEIQSRLAYVSCVRQLEMVKSGGLGEYVRLPIDRIGTLQFGRFEEIYDIGLQHSRTVISGWTRNIKMQHLFIDNHVTKETQPTSQQQKEQLPSQLQKLSDDLAAVASQIPQKDSSIPLSFHKCLSEAEFPVVSNTEEEYGLGYWSSPELDVLSPAMEPILQLHEDNSSEPEGSPEHPQHSRSDTELAQDLVLPMKTL